MTDELPPDSKEGYGLKRRPVGRPPSCSCNECPKCKKRIYMKEYLKKPKQLARVKEYRAKPEVVQNRRSWYKKHYNDDGANQEHRRDYANSYTLNRRSKDLHFKIAGNLRGRLRAAIKKGTKVGSAVTDLGCSIDQFKDYISSKFKPGMTWDNWSHDTWHLDHIKPLIDFDLSAESQLKEACHYTNLQPLWAEENMSKCDR